MMNNERYENEGEQKQLELLPTCSFLLDAHFYGNCGLFVWLLVDLQTTSYSHITS